MSKSLQTPVEIDTAIHNQAIETAKARAAVERQEKYLSEEYKHLRYRFDADKYGDVLAALAVEQAKDDELQALYTGWTRYWHVTNVNGHIHTGRNCSSCFPTTEYAWRTDLSGLTPAEVVEREAYNACSVCMPIAPAEQRAARTAYTKAERERKAAEKAAAKLEKEIAKIPRQHTLALKVNELFDAFGDDQSAAYHATYPGERFGKGYDNAYHVYSDTINRRNRRRSN